VPHSQSLHTQPTANSYLSTINEIKSQRAECVSQTLTVSNDVHASSLIPPLTNTKTSQMAECVRQTLTVNNDVHASSCIPPLTNTKTSQTATVPNNSINSAVNSIVSHINCALVNCRSIKNKELSLVDLINDRQISIIALTETWLKNDPITDNCILNDASPPGYHFINSPRTGRRGGGIALIFMKTFNVVVLPPPLHVTHFEYLATRITFSSRTVIFVIIYRSPSSSLIQFFEQLTDFFSHYVAQYDEIVFVGDFNLRINSDLNVRNQFFDLLDSLNLIQLVTMPTHQLGGILDLVITRASSKVISKVTLSYGLADHFSVIFCLSFPSPRSQSITRTFRPYRQLNTEDLKGGMLQLNEHFLNVSNNNLPVLSQCTGWDKSVEYFHFLQTKVLDYLCPFKTKSFVEKRTKFPCMTPEVRRTRSIMRKFERRWRFERSDLARRVYATARSAFHAALLKSKMEYFSSELVKNTGNCRQYWKVLNTVMSRNSDISIPSCTSLTTLADQFNNHFFEKVARAHSKLALASNPHSNVSSHSNRIITAHSLERFTLVSESTLLQTLKYSPKSTNLNDPMPAWLLYQCTPCILPSLTHIVNLALLHGMPRIYKEAVVTPLLKKSSLDKEDFNNYRPISNLFFLSKVIERIVSSQVLEHLTNNDLLDPFQSAYKIGHSTETLLAHLHDVILSSMDSKKVVVLVMLDLSSAFDTVDHHLLLLRLASLGITGNVLNWFEDYLSNRSQTVAINGTLGSSRPVTMGVPQGSVLGPLLFSLYISGLREVFLSHNIPYHCYADDLQAFVSVEPCRIPDAIERLEKCISDVVKWLAGKLLLVNGSKTELIIFGTKALLKKCPSVELRVDGVVIRPSDCVRNLGVFMDKNLTMEKHINRLVSASFSYLRMISRIRRSLSTASCKLLVNAFVFSRIDYCASLLCGISGKYVNKVQKIINAAMRMIEKLPKTDHVSVHMKNHKWLPAGYRLKKRLFMLMFKVLNGKAPAYLRQVLVGSFTQTHSHCMRSQVRGSLPVSRCCTRMGERAFSIAGPKAWNSLPQTVRDEKRLARFTQLLDEHLLVNAYLCD
jgi:hypothetical protein